MPSTPERGRRDPGYEDLQHVLDVLVPGARAEHARTLPECDVDPETLERAIRDRSPEFQRLRRWAWETYFGSDDGYRAFGADPHPKHRP